MADAKQPPDLNIPASNHTVSVSVIDTTGYVGNIPAKSMAQPRVPGYDELSVPCYAFIIKHNNPEAKSKYDTLIFDLGVRTDWGNGPKAIVESVGQSGFDVRAEKDVATILKENGEDLDEVGGIIWSHWHWDHTGDPSTFPSTTDLIVGPGFSDNMLPGYPAKQDAHISESAYKGRKLREIDFNKESKGLKLGRYTAIDLYGDGSFFLLDSPGHAIGHMCGLARTTANPPTYMFLGGDIAHHGGEFRPTQYLPLPKEIVPSPLVAPYTTPAPVCPGSMFEELHPKKSRTETFMHPSNAEGSFHSNPEEAVESIGKLGEFDAYDNIFAVIAHDGSLYDVVEFYPKPANDWKAKGWKKEGLWRFLGDFDTGNEKPKAQFVPSNRTKP